MCHADGGREEPLLPAPSLVRPGLTIVVSPLIALMKDQVDALQKRGIAATLINSSLTPSEQNQRLELVAEGKFSLVYVAPERLRNQRFLEVMRSHADSVIAVDEGIASVNGGMTSGRITPGSDNFASTWVGSRRWP